MLCLGGCGLLGEAWSAQALSSVQAAQQLCAALRSLVSENQRAACKNFLCVTQAGLAGTSTGVEPSHGLAWPGVGPEFHFEFS